MIDRTQSEPVGAILQSGDDAMPVTRHAIPVFPIPVRIGNADLHVVEVQLHAAAGIVPAVPLHVNHTELAGEDRLGRYARRRHVTGHQSHDHRTPFAQPVGIRGNRAHAELIALPAFQPADADRQPLRVRHPAGNPRRTSRALAILHAVARNVDGGVIRRLRDRSPLQGSQTQRGTTTGDIGVRLHHKTSHGLRRPMVFFRSGQATTGAAVDGATGDALHSFRLTDGRIVNLVVQHDRSFELIGFQAQRDLLDTHLLPMHDSGSGDPITRTVIDKRKARRIIDTQRPRVLSVYARRSIQSGLHVQGGGVVIADTLLGKIRLPLAPRGRGCGIIPCEGLVVIALHENMRGQSLNAFLFRGFEHVMCQLDGDTAQVTA